MNKFLLPLTLTLALLVPQSIQAKRNVTEDDKVEVTLRNGKVKTGYICDHWFNANRVNQQNYKFKFITQPEQGKDDAYEFTVNDVSKVIFLTPAEGRPRLWIPCSVAQYNTEKVMSLLSGYTNQFMGVVKNSAHATLLTCQTLVTSNMSDYEKEPATLYTVRLDSTAMVYPIVCNNMLDIDAFCHFFKAKEPGFVSYVKNHVRNNKRKKEIVKHPEKFLDLYEDFLKTYRTSQ